MEKSLEALLVFACLEIEGSTKNVVIDALSETMQALLQHQELFEKLPETIVKTSESLRKQEDLAMSPVGLSKDIATNFGTHVDEIIEYFDDEALLIHDGITASAFGRMSYIYRSKGTRLYLLSSGELIILTPYSYIDHHGFQLKNEISISYGADYMNLSIDEVKDFISHTSEEPTEKDTNQFVCGELIKILCSIKEKFYKDFYLEYLLTPPDVDKLSKFSQNNKIILWDICLSDSFKQKWGVNFQHLSMNILSSIGIPPSSGQLVNYIKSSESNEATLSDILNKLNELSENVVDAKKTEIVDCFDLKPNFFGIGINFNEVYKRIKEAKK